MPLLAVVDLQSFRVQLHFMRVAFVVAIMALMFVEYMRVVRVPNAGGAIHGFMAKYIGACRECAFHLS